MIKKYTPFIIVMLLYIGIVESIVWGVSVLSNRYCDNKEIKLKAQMEVDYDEYFKPIRAIALGEFDSVVVDNSGRINILTIYYPCHRAVFSYIPAVKYENTFNLFGFTIKDECDKTIYNYSFNDIVLPQYDNRPWSATICFGEHNKQFENDFMNKFNEYIIAGVCE